MRRFPSLLLVLLALSTSAVSAEDAIPLTGAAVPELAAFDRLMQSFLAEHDVPGASLAIARYGRIVYARGFGFADRSQHRAVEPDALFRIASISKPFTSAAIFQLVERGKLKLDEPAFKILGLTPYLPGNASVDPRLWEITIRQLLQHSGGFDRGASFDPMFRPIAIARALGTNPPAGPKEIIEYMMGRPLDFDPGTKEAYSNFGYCVLGRIIEKVTGDSYAAYVQQEILSPLGIHRMRLGRTLQSQQAEGEVQYYPRSDRRVKSIFGDGQVVPVAYGGWNLEAMDSHGGWIATASELVKFASSFDDPAHSPILKGPATIAEIFRRPDVTGFDADGKPKPAYYACGWQVRPVGSGKANTWHNGLLDGTSSLLVRRADGLTWAVLFNTESDQNHKTLSGSIDPLLHPVADSIRNWPEGSPFSESK